ncbi:DBLOX family protein [Megaselia abdita]
MTPIRLIAFLCFVISITNTQCTSTPEDLLPNAFTALQLEKDNSVTVCNNSVNYDVCPPSKFRSSTGECNNISHRKWGARGDVFLRLLKPNYADDISQPRSSRGTHALPDAESLIQSIQSHLESGARHPHITAMLPAWGQLLSHDLVEFTQIPSEINCCRQTRDIKNPEEIRQCYVRLGADCKEYQRTAPGYDPESCSKNQREQMNAASSYVDASGLYGNTDEAIASIRSNKQGLVKLDNCKNCKVEGATGALHTTLLLEHNRIAKELLKFNPGWNDDDLFYESRRVVSAIIQHITYNEFLPLVLGNEIMATEGLRLTSGKHFTNYSSTNRGGVFNEFATSAIPAFLTMYPPEMISKKTSTNALLTIAALQKTVRPQGLDENSWSPLALAIQRARDHGVPSYKHALDLCEKRFENNDVSNITFDGLSVISAIPDYQITLLKDLYQTADDIDLLVGAILEEPAVGSLFGPTITCLFSEQFKQMKRSDRFWYENDIPPSSFSIEQLKSIRHTSLSGLLCQSTDVKRAQPKAFMREDEFLNTQLPCDQLPQLDLWPWQVEYIEEEHKPPMKEIEPEVKEAISDLNPALIEAAVERAKDELLNRKKFEYESWLARGGIDAKSPDGVAASFSKANKQAISIGNHSLIFELTSNEILNTLNSISRRKRQIFDNSVNLFNRNELTDSLQSIDISSFLSDTPHVQPNSHCEDPATPCDPTSPFRTITGYCNNLRNPSWGKSLSTFSRLLPAQYDDGVSAPRLRSVGGGQLPNPRTISTLIHPDISNLHTRYSLMVMQYAQFLDHDLTLTPIHKGFHESIPSCRSCSSRQTVHPECNPFTVPPGDYFYPEVNVTSGERLCFPSMRSLPGQTTLGPRDQINQNTHFLDSSQVYGENNCVASGLRGFSGRMNSTIHPIRGKELLPQSNMHPECKSKNRLCYIGGDERASEQAGLTSIHTIFLREHNRIVEGLRGVNPHWNGDQLYHHARRIVSAMNQQITFNEFLPRVLSWNAVNLYGLKLQPQGYYKEYNPACSPIIFNEFAAAAFRIGHSLLRPHIPRLSPSHQPVDPPILLRDSFFRMDIISQPGMIDEISRGLVATPMETLDQFITGEVTNHLFEDRKIPFSGVDLIALNVQRARDHGIPSYNNYRALCNLKRARSWNDLSREIPSEVIARFQKIYESVDDIDLFPGAMSERPLQGGLVGPTLACIIGIQFRQLRKCDRFW